MPRFVRIQQLDADLDEVNVDHIVRIHAEGVTADQWVVSVTLSTGLVLVDSRHQTKVAAEARIQELVADSVK